MTQKSEIILKLKDAIQNIGERNATDLAEKLAKDMGLDWDGSVSFIFKTIAKDLERVPVKIGAASDNEHQVINKWLKKYQKGMAGCPSKRISGPLTTIADPIIEEIIGARLTRLKKSDLHKVSYAHRLAMSAENILGLLLEEYLAKNLKEYGWHCAWGETVRSVDFVNENGELLQIKNRSNSENSSSSAVRSGTIIDKWYRIKADRIEYMWFDLNNICSTTHLSEESFVTFVKKTITDNQQCFSVETGNPWAKNVRLSKYWHRKDRTRRSMNFSRRLERIRKRTPTIQKR